MVNDEPIKKPVIEVTRDGPFVVRDLRSFFSSSGGPIKTQQEMRLCRCGRSRNKPFCDGTHARTGFSGAKDEDRTPDETIAHKGREITIHDNRGICASAGVCSRHLPTVYRSSADPWVDPNGAKPEDIAAVSRLCPSGALYHTIKGVQYRDFQREPMIVISRNGPLKVTGSIELRDPEGCRPESNEHYTLCRCGRSLNKPFCDGSHTEGFEDSGN
jgi:CDGSH-type Zn-finger protein